MAKNGLRLDADFNEDAVGFAIESFLSVISFPRQQFTVEPFSRQRERWLGADARLLGRTRGFTPFYMQFKRPSAYPSNSNSRIIRDRKQMKPTALDVDPRTLFFSLRDKQPNHDDYQHNVLFRLRERLRRRNLGDAAYVCPLFLDRSSYRFHLHVSALARWTFFWRLTPLDLRDILIHSTGAPFSASQIPVLAEHVCIPPHAIVTHARHSYSFTEDGTQLCFHSPEQIQDKPARLDKWVTELLSQKVRIVKLDEAMAELKSLLIDEETRETLPFPPDIFENKTGVSAWLEWGDFLRHTFSVEQFAILQWE